MSKITISFAGSTDLGNIRTNNEDAFIIQNIWDNDHILAVAIDGVGGHEGGEVAAEIVQTTLIEYLQSYPNGERINLLKQAVTEANNQVFKQRGNQPMFANMSCVLTACLIEIDAERVNMVHVGDTRLYQYSNNRLRKLSHDHSLIGYREEVGDLTEDEAMNHPQRNLIGRDVGSELHQPDDKDFLEAAIFPLNPNSTLLLSSDGLHDMLKSNEITSILSLDIPVENKVKDLIDAANDKGGKDNITVALVEYSKDIPPQNKIEEITEESIVVENPQPHKREKKISIKILLVPITILLFGIIIGWLIRDNYLCLVAKQTTSPDRAVIISRDTIEVMGNDSLRIFVTGNELRTDTVEINN